MADDGMDGVPLSPDEEAAHAVAEADLSERFQDQINKIKAGTTTKEQDPYEAALYDAMAHGLKKKSRTQLGQQFYREVQSSKDY